MKHDRRINHLSYEDASELIALITELLSKSDKSTAKTFMYDTQS